MFKLLNVNPSGKKTGDCVIRAIAKAEEKEWEDVFNDLVDIAREVKSVPTYKDAYEKYLSKYETLPVKYINGMGDTKRYRVRDIASAFDGTYVVSIANHLTVVTDGVIYDLWNCMDKCAYKIWKIK